MENNSAKILFPVLVEVLHLISMDFVCISIGKLQWHIKGVSQRKQKRQEWTSVEVEENNKNCHSYHHISFWLWLTRLFLTT